MLILRASFDLGLAGVDKDFGAEVVDLLVMVGVGLWTFDEDPLWPLFCVAVRLGTSFLLTSSDPPAYSPDTGLKNVSLLH